MDTSEKTTMEYRVITARNPKTGDSLLRPRIINRKTLKMRQMIAYAKTAGYVRGQTRDLEGLVGGFIQAIQDRALAGYSINVNDWFIVSGQLKGTVGEDYQLTAANSYHVTITATKDLKATINDFSWHRVDEGVSIKVESLTSPNGVKNEIVQGKSIIANGKNLAFHSEWNDSITVSWVEEGEAKSETLVPSEQSETYFRFNEVTALSTIPAGTTLTFTFKLHATQGGAEQTSTLVVPLVSAA